MPNYEMIFGVSKVARALEIDRELIKKWAYLFRDYLQPAANPQKGKSRQFCAEDVRVLAYISMYWEDDPDIESIKIGLNAEEYYEDIYEDFMTALTPLFVDPPEGLNENWRHGALIGGMGELSDTFALADSYKIAGDMLVDAALSSDNVDELICPIIYNYRHATELYLKATVMHYEPNHNLNALLHKFKELLKSEFNKTVPEWFEDIILVFVDFDPGGVTFRYGEYCPGEVWVDILHIKTLMNWLAESFRRIKRRRIQN